MKPDSKKHTLSKIAETLFGASAGTDRPALMRQVKQQEAIIKLQYKDKTASKRQVYADLSAIIIDSVTEWGFTDYSITPYDVFYHHGEIILEAKGVTVTLRETGNYSYELTVS